ncbi:YdcF family protein [Acinetobacter sp. 194]|uniref:YdcF family protein n=1 Tax=Acinetobacter shaoyimingii TaxID=2715164 RepID=UPI00140AB4C8|nr:YdcF family protein [Acinetobacter shaoyimingii]NHB57631.1 YdcF family protein [Acinetobacter shaoyimingii]
MLKSKFFKFILLAMGVFLFLYSVLLLIQHRYGLGTILPLFIGLMFCIQSLYDQKIHHFLIQHPRLKQFYKMAWAVFSVWFITVCLFFAYLKYQMLQPEHVNNIDAIVVLGSGTIKGKPSPTLVARLDRAAEIAQQHPHTTIILSGGLDALKQHTEAQIMSDYLQKNYQINANKIELEDRSTSTYLNLKNSQVLLKKNGLTLQSPLAIVTSDFHTPRASLIAKKQGYKNFITIRAKTPLVTRYSSWLREYFAYISGWILGEF